MTSPATAKAPAAAGVPYRTSDLLALTLWFGVVVGLLEGASFLLLQTAGLLTWNIKATAVDQNILWAATLMDVAVFLVAGIGLWVVLAWWRPARWLFATHVVFGSLGWYVFVSMSGRLRERGALMLSLGLGVVVARLLARNEAGWMGFVRRSVVKVMVLAVVVGCAAASGDWMYEKYEDRKLAAAPAGAPNVLLIVLDTLRMDRLGAYGSTRGTTPFLDSFATRSVVFEKAFANAPWTLPSHVTFFTGKMPFEHGATLEPYDGRFPTIAQAMAARGYSTVGVVANNALATRPFGMGRGFHRYENLFTGWWDSATRTMLGRKLQSLVVAKFFARYMPREHMPASEVNQRFLSWVDQHRDRPFFAFLNYMETHLPNDPPREFMQKFARGRSRVDFETAIRQDPFDPQEIEYLDGVYDAMVAYLDSELKRLFDGLAARGLEKDLLVIIVSDHGESIGEHQLIGHRISLYTEQLRVPLMIRMPGKAPEGTRVADPVSLFKLPATIMQLSGGAAGEFPGAPLSECWTGGNCAEELILGEVDKGRNPGADKHWPVKQGWVKSLIAGQWHLIVQQDGKIELYDWHKDPGELNNLAQSEEGREVVKQLTEKLAAWVPQAKEWAAQKANTAAGSKQAP
ncbi:MAG: sulfatase-like hydrolase/transferase [Acidobacteria bacterium]|nr:sulfatase-like hydrolase/transferase [Acidobacteriota bacterium]MCL5288127.1 sulfatase-like hydrolase/transferase [Acidobacteriota bacterium]